VSGSMGWSSRPPSGIRVRPPASRRSSTSSGLRPPSGAAWDGALVGAGATPRSLRPSHQPSPKASPAPVRARTQPTRRLRAPIRLCLIFRHRPEYWLRLGRLPFGPCDRAVHVRMANLPTNDRMMHRTIAPMSPLRGEDA